MSKATIISVAAATMIVGLSALGHSGKAMAATPLTTVRVASGLSRPLFIGAAPGDNQRLFIVEQYSGKIKILANGSVQAAPFIDIHSLITTAGNEQGLLGLAFHPDYANNGFFFVDYTDTSGATVIERFHVSPNPDSADPASGQIILRIAQPYSNHNGGMIAFGPNDGYLYVGMGDGGLGGDPENRAQNPDSLLGKILRIDIDGGSPYAIPTSNPYYGKNSPRPEIWAMGVRNPWRYSFDKSTADLYIADVGQNSWEEIDFQPANDTGGENYGWRLMEGNHCYNPPTNCDPGGNLVLPIYEYGHSSGKCSITGGYVYRGCAIPDLQGTYFFGDYCSGQIWSFRYSGGIMSEFMERTVELAPGGGQSINMITSFGQDNAGEIYIVDQGGEIFKIVPDGVASGCSFNCGDIDANGTINLLDISFLINFLYRNGPAPMNLNDADVNHSGSINILDVAYLINFLYKSGSNPVCA
ncbi:conserved exported hypothetical protein [Candidatus Zixiibacteriota bacterium]|nr:conserved exported hypothetical protein [candidate division Zixibacteria bacterium]